MVSVFFVFISQNKIKENKHFFRTAFFAMLMLTTLCIHTAYYGGTITLKVGETYYVDASFGGGLTQTGSWLKSNSTFAFVSRGNKSCTIRGYQVGTGTLYYTGVAGAYDASCYWTVNVVSSGGDNQSKITINSTNFPDTNFRNFLLGQSYGADGVLTEEEIEYVTSMYIDKKGITNLKGIEFFTSLKELSCYSIQLTSLDVSKNTALTYLYCSDNQLTSLNVPKTTTLIHLYCSDNLLTSLEVSKNTKLTELSCYRNNIKKAVMDVLINGLPNNTTNNVYTFNVYRDTENDEGNVCTKSQVSAIKAKGWMPRYYNGSAWVEYEGMDDDDADAIVLPTTESADENTPIYNLAGQRVESLQGKKGVFIIGGKKVMVK